jgi:hypothetical protein
MAEYKQAEFRRVKDNAWTIGWIKLDRKLKEGDIVTLRDSKGKWKIVKIYEDIKTEEDIKTGWNVGGL